ncbi:unnamed protein product [Candida verbasci]|uniref:RNA-binding protein VTS1 n=1 Tax=Candida verbasci TaxID=1227364 RepID=A0A9W4TYL2_9ASCO|nr:unnamed protein product [Candida verbasci]
MDKQNDINLTTTDNTRPIILSPPLLDRHQLQNSHTQFPFINQDNSNLDPSRHTSRQQSVGFNLQHEFETLTADLDLDLKNQLKQNETQHSQSQSQPNPSLLAPSASKFTTGTADLLGNNTLSPNPTSSFHKPQLSNLLDSRTEQFLNHQVSPMASIPNRPQSVNDFNNVFNYGQQPHQTQSQPLPQSNFYSDLLIFSNWIENLNPQDNLIMIDYLCQNLPLDILLTFKSKLDQYLQTGKRPQQQQQSIYSSNSNMYPQELYTDMEQLNINRKQPQQFKNPYLMDKFSRPKSADPFFQQQQQFNLDRAKSPTSHLYEKTSFLQLAANNGQYNHSHNLNHQDDSVNAMKLGALQTINSRVALDSNRKHPYQPQQADINRSLNSSSVPASIQRSPFNKKSNKKSPISSPTPTSATSTTSISSMTNSSMPLEITNIELLNNIPAWLKVLRLHKYTDCLKDIPWNELIELNNDELESKGVSALGARRKLLKAFGIVKGKDVSS